MNYLYANHMRTRNRIADKAQQAILGTEGGTVYVPQRDGFLYIRFVAGTDENGFAKYSPPAIARAGVGSAYIPQAGRRVWVGYGYDGQLEIKQGDFTDLLEAGITPIASNPLAPETKFFSTDMYMPLRSSAIGTGANPSTKVKVNQWIYYLDEGQLSISPSMGGGTGNPDLSAHIPSAQNHCYAVLWLDVYLNDFVVTTSTPQSMFTALDITDLQECIVDRPADGVPIKAFYLADNQASVVQRAEEVDLRQLINTPPLTGYANPVTHHTRIWGGRELIVRGTYAVTSATLTNYGMLWVA